MLATDIDNVPPDLEGDPSISPAVGRSGTHFTIGLVTTEPLLTPPELTLRLNPPVTVACAELAPQNYSCDYLATGEENDRLGGLIDFDVRLVDLGQNEKLKRLAGVLVLDFTPPTIVSRSVLPPVARLGSPLEVLFTGSEPLAAPALLLASAALDQGDGGTQSIFALEPDGTTTNYRFVHPVTAADPDGEVNFTVTMTDKAGNTTVNTVVGGAVIDKTLPALSQGLLTPEWASDGVEVAASFVVNKPLTAPPVVTLGGLPMTRDPSVASPAYRYTRAAAAADGDGLKAVLVVGVDLAGNTLAENLGGVTFDFIAPALSSRSVLPDVARLASPLELLFSSTEPLTGPAILTSSTPLDDGAGGVQSTFLVAPDGTSSNYRFVHTVTALDPNGVVNFTVSMTDRAGNTATGLVVGSSLIDRSPPGLSSGVVSPEWAKDGVEVEATFVATKPLAAPPVVTVRGLPMTRDSSVAVPAYRYTRTAATADGDGFSAVLVAGVDLAGNNLFETVGGVTFDFTPPALAARSVLPAVARLGSPLEIFFSSTEPLAGPAIVVASAPLDDGAGGMQTTFVLGPEGATTNYRLVHTVTAADPEGVVNFTVSMTDRAGNPAAGLVVGSSLIDKTLPTLSQGVVSPSWATDGTVVVATFEVSKPLTGTPAVTLGGLPMTRDVGVALPAYRYTRAAALADGDGLKAVLVVGVDSAGNSLAANVGAVTFDFIAPRVASAAVGYRPESANPLGSSITQAKVGTVVSVTVLADEPLRTGPSGPGVPPTLSATDGSTTLTFCVVGLTCAGDTRPSSFSSTGATFEATIPAGATDGVYVPTVSWADVAGNVGTTPFASPPVRVKTRTPTLLVDQTKVRFVRSPWGNAAAEDLGNFTIPAGPYFALAPFDPLENTATLPATTFTFAAATPKQVRVWAQATMRTPLGALGPNGDGSWPRQQLVELDTSAAWVTGVDEAGNESAAVRLVNAEWVATPSPASLGASPHLLQLTRDSRKSLLQGVQNSWQAGPGAEGADAQAVLVAAANAWQEIAVSGAMPAGRAYHSMAYDSARGRVVLFGGYTGTSAKNDLWEWDGRVWVEKTPTGAKPNSRWRASMAYDSARGRVVLFGGYAGSGGYLQDLWEWDGTTWEEKTPPGAKPSARSSAAMTYDSIRRRLVLFGGTPGGAARFGDLWEWDGASWVDRTPSTDKPTGRLAAAMGFDSRRGRTVMFGGEDGELRADLWEWDGSSWIEQFPSGDVPTARSGAAMAYDGAQGQLVMFGGGSPLSQEVWAWNGSVWVDQTPAGAQPSRRADMQLVFDNTRGRCLLFGGYDGYSGGNGYTRDQWEWDGTSWVETTPSGATPGLRSSTSLTYDTARRRVVLFGGYSAGALQQDLWEWNGSNWLNQTPAGTKPPPRGDAVMANDRARGRVVLFGGYTMVPYESRQDVWEWDGTSWEDRTPAGAKPAIRHMAMIAYDEVRARVVLFGGRRTDGLRYGDTWEWDGTTWVEKTPASGPSPSARTSGAMAYDSARQRVVLFGGDDATGATNDLWEWDGLSWVDITPLGPLPARRQRAPMAYDAANDRMVLFGGLIAGGSGGYGQDTWEWDGASWVDQTPAGAKPSRRFDARMTYDSDRQQVVLVGGHDGTSNPSDVWEWQRPRQPAVLFTAGAASGSFSPEAIVGLRVRARCGGTFAPYEATSTGTDLLAWSTSGPMPGSWSLLGANSAGLSMGWIDWSAASPAEAQRYYATRDQQLTVQCRPSGTSAGATEVAKVALDYVELRVRY